MIQNEYLTPRQIVSELDKYIIGQNDAKKNVAIALRNRWRRMNVTSEIKNEIIPNNILMIGSTGVGKTEIARRLARIADAPFTKVEASKFTEVGYVGRDVESMVRDLVDQSVNLVKINKQKEVKERAEQLVEEIILNALIPPMKGSAPASRPSEGEAPETTPSSDQELNEKTREIFRKKIRNGELDDRKIQIDIRQNTNPGMSVVGGGIMDDVSMMNLQEMINGMMPKKNKKRMVTIRDAKTILLEEEAGKLIESAGLV